MHEFELGFLEFAFSEAAGDRYSHFHEPGIFASVFLQPSPEPSPIDRSNRSRFIYKQGTMVGAGDEGDRIDSVDVAGRRR